MPRFIPCLGLIFLLLAGCAPRLTPTLAEREVLPEGAVPRTGRAAAGESLLRGLDRYVYTVYAPRAALVVPVPARAQSGRLEPDQRWFAFFRLDDGTLVAEAPPELAREGERLGLRMDAAGMVTGNRPWFDLRAGARLNQSAWTGPRLLFRDAGRYPVDVFAFDVRYAGRRDRDVLFDVRDFKEAGMKPDEWKRVRVAPGGTLSLHGLTIRVIEALPDLLRYEIESFR